MRVDVEHLYPEERKAFEECAPRLTTDEQKEFVALPAPLRSDWLTYHCTGLHNRFESCKAQLTPEQQEVFLKLKNEERGPWMDSNCALPGTAADPSQPPLTMTVELTTQQMYSLENCSHSLTRVEKVQLAEADPSERDRWLSLHCDDMYAFGECSPSLTVAQQKTFFALRPVDRWEWLATNCAKAVAGNPVAPIADGEGTGPAYYHMMPAFNRCKSRLSNDQRAEFLELPPNQRYRWLDKTCGDATPMVPTSSPTPVMLDTGAMTRPRGSSDYGWPASRIAAHATFWPGLLAAVGGVAALLILDGEEPAYWVPGLALGGVLILVAIVSAANYSSWKKSQVSSHGFVSLERGPTLSFGRWPADGRQHLIVGYRYVF